MANTLTQPAPTNHGNGRDAVAGLLARWIVYGAVIYLSMMSLLFVGLILISLLTNTSKVDSIAVWKDLMTITVPVLAAWVGAILAFYFAKENFEAANKSVQDMANRLSSSEKLGGISAREAMVPRNSISDLKLASGETPASISLEQKIIAKLQGKITRVPVFNQDDAIFCVVHESTAHKYLYQVRQANPNPTLDDLLKDAMLGPAAIALAFVPEAASLADAQEAMKQVAGCQDVFVTKNGRREEPVLGWVTNADIAKQIEV